MSNKKAKIFSGIIDDPRSKKEKSKDYQAEEVVTFSPVEWKEKDKKNYRRFKIRKQNGSGMCVAFATALALGVENLLEENKMLNISALDIYDRRANKPEAGMWFNDALEIAKTFGACTGELLPYENLTEKKANLPVKRTNEMLNVAQTYRGGKYVALPINIERIASVIKEGKIVILGFSFNYDEWTDVPVILSNEPSLRHGVGATDFTLFEGKKCLVIQDSWGESYGLDGLRVITESFLKARCFYAGYILARKNEGTVTEKPRHTFTKILTYGMKNDEDVRALQEILNYEGLFDFDEFTGNYMQITAKGIDALQKKYSIASALELSIVQGKRVGQKTINWLNANYGS